MAINAILGPKTLNAKEDIAKWERWDISMWELHLVVV